LHDAMIALMREAVAAPCVPIHTSRVRHATSAIEWLVDNASAYDEVLRAIGRARRAIWISQLAFDADCVAHRADTDRAATPAMAVEATALPSADEPPRKLIDALVDASRTRGVDVYILLNASLLLDTAEPLRVWLAREDASRIHVRGISVFPRLLHAKMMIVDEDEAILLGSPFVNGYWDDPSHPPTDARRPDRELGGRPLHDVSARVTGPAVSQLATIFAELWNDVSSGPATPGAHRLTVAPRGRRDPHVDVVRTAPHSVLPRDLRGHMGILQALEAGMDRARSLIYIEHQYLSARPIIDALVRALAREPALEIIIVLNQNPDITAYRGWQNTRLADAGLFDHPRVGVFSLWTASARAVAATTLAVNQLFVHSKVLLIDDDWASVGSANLDGVSLHSYGDDFAGQLGRSVFHGVRNFDVNLVARTNGERPGPAASLRVSLWREHLGADVPVMTRPNEGWLPLWREAAARNIAGLNGVASGIALAMPMSGFVLPYSTHNTPAEQLRDVGVNSAGRLDLCFDPSWLEIHFSPNWLRNVFT
jgi:phosphatidylserine/phosphatidylglycerophosphate/cardiolipin synthase-like enzyme